MSILLSLCASNVKGNTKKAVVNSAFFIGYSAGAIAGPQFWRANQAPRFHMGIECAIISWAVFLVSISLYWFVCARENAKRVGHSRSMEMSDVGLNLSEIGKDVTDKEDLSFRYST